ncbi:MAG TPA: SPOR domain-containing protein [Longimicrobiales bacterium]
MSDRTLASAGLLLLLVSAPLSAQTHVGALGVYGGASRFSDLAPNDPIETRLATGWLAGLEIERWLGSGRVGLRIGGDYAEREMETGDGSDFNLYSGNAALLFRLLPPDPGRTIAPYVAIGGGALHVNSGLGPSLAANFYQDPVTRPTALIGLGADLFPRNSAGLRLEAADRVIIESPFGDPATGRSIRPVHHGVVRLAVQLRFGQLPSQPRVLAFERQEPEPVPEPPAAEPPVMEPTTTEPPAAEPTLTPEPEPTPEPTPSPSAPTLDSVAAVVAANTAELARLRAQVTDLGRALEQQRRAGAVERVAAQPTTSRMYTVQVAAFNDANSARLLADRVRRSGIPVWVSQVALNGRTYHRVRVGALPSRSEAVQLARRIRRDYALQVWVAPISRSDHPPADAVATTRAVLNGS